MDKEYITFMKGVSIGRIATVGGSLVTVESIDGINDDYKKIMKNRKESDSLAIYEINVAIMNYFAGNSELAINILKEVDYIKDWELKIYRQINLAAMYIELSRFEEAEAIIKNNLEYKEYEEINKLMLGTISFFRNEHNWKEDIKNINYCEENIQDKIEQLNKMKYDVSIFRGFYSICEVRDKITSFEKTENYLHGKVTYNEEAQRGVIVYLKRKASANAFRSGDIMFNDLFFNNHRYPFAISDQNGEYEIENIPDGEYELTIMSTWQKIYGKTIRVKNNELTYEGNENIEMDIEMFDSVKVTSVKYISDNEIKITWDNPIDDDEFNYYIIPVYSYKNKDGHIIDRRDYNYRNAHEEILEKEAIVDIDFIKRNALGSINEYPLNDSLFPNQLFETFYLGGDYEFRIAYHNKSDYHYFNFESGGLFPNIKEDKIYIEGNELNKGDKLILKRNYVEAIDWFEKYITKESYNVHALNILSAIYTDGYRLRDEEGYDEWKDAYGRDVKMAKEVTEQLYSIVGNKREVLLRLQKIYTELKMYDERDKIKTLLE